MSTPLILALDSGTSVIKAVAFEADGRTAAAVARPNRFSQTPDGGAEQDMAANWADAVGVLGELVARLAATRPGATFAALAVTGQGDGTWLIDAEGAPVGPALLWLDARAAPIVEALRADGAAAAAFRFTGTGLNACQQSAQLRWLAEARPAALGRAALALHCKDWLYFNFTGALASDPSEACFTFGDWRARCYRDEVSAALGLVAERRLLPPIVDGTRQSHPLTAAAARATGLPAGLPVVLGYVDVVCTALGGGIYGAGEAGVSIIGSTGMHLRLARDPAEVVASAAITGYCMPFPVPGHTMQAQTNMAATLNIDWLAGLLRQACRLAGAAEPTPAAVLGMLDRAAAEARPGAVLFHPFISSAGERGPFTDARARAAMFGFDQSAGLAEVARGVLEGLGFAARDCFAAIGGAPAELRISGGAGRSPAMRQILAAALDRPVRWVAQPEAGAAGAAMIAACRIGLFADMQSCAQQWITPLLGVAEPPDPALTTLYARLFPLYRDGYLAMRDLWQRLPAARETPDAS